MFLKQKYVIVSVSFLFSLVCLTGLAYASETIEFKDPWSKQGININTTSKSGLDLDFSVERFIYEDKMVDGKAARAIKMAGSILPIGDGYPDLPVVSNYVAVPNGARPKVTVISYREEKYQDVDIAPGMELPTEQAKAFKPLQKKTEIYSKNEFFPKDFVMQSELQKMRGVDVFILSISPFRYNPVTKELVVRRDMKISITFEGGKGEFGDDLYRHPMFERILQQNIINYSSIQPSKYSQIHDQALAASKPGAKETGEFEYIIIIPNDPAFIAWADTLKQFRKKQGIKTGVFTTTEIGGNTPAILEAFIDNAYNTWTIKPLAVLLMSDLGSTSKAYGITSSTPLVHPAGYDDYVSDNVFADATITDAASTWSNGGAPEMVFTRMPAQTAAQCSIMVKKIINYEKSPPSSASFYNLPLSAAGWQDERWFGMCSEIVRGFLKNKLGKTTQQQYALVDASGPAGGDPWSTTDPSALVAAYGPAGENYIAATVPSGMDWSSGTAAGVVTAVNNGCFMIMHRDHGMYTGWGEPAFTTANIPSLTNTNHPFVFSMNCQTGAYQNPTTQTFSEMLHRIQYGALGVMCATEVSYSFVNDALIMGIMDGMWPNFNSTNNWDVPNAGSGQTYERYTEDLRPAFAMASGKWHLMTQTYTDAAIPADYKEFTCQLFHVFGDPYMTFCSQIPDTFTLTFNSVIPTGTQSFSVNVKNKAGANVMGALVGVYMPTNSPEIVTSALTDANGNVSITINPLLDGTLYVTATKSNFVRKETFTTVNAGTPTKPAITKLFDGAKVPELRPYLTFVSTDPQGNSIDYRVIWDTTSAFTSAARDSSTTSTYASGTPVSFQFPSNLTAGRTYWWKVKGRDPAGTNVFGPTSDPRSFTVNTDIPAGTVCWFHTKGGQFSCDSYTGAAAAQGDSVILAAPSTGSVTLINENFEGGALPSGWATSGTYSSNYGWLIRTSGGTQPPSYGTTYEGCQFPSAGAAPGASEEIITTGQYTMNTGAVACSLTYGYGMDPGAAADSLVIEASFLSGSTWGSWIQVDGLNNGTTTISGTKTVSLNSYMPQDGIQLRWRFSQGGGRNGQDAAIDNVVLKYAYSVPNTNGIMTSGPIYYKDITKSETVSRSVYKWGKVLWRKKAAADSIGVQVQYCNNNVWTLVPDAVLGGNSKGFFNQGSATDSVSLAGLDTVTYDSLRVMANLYRPSSKATANPVLYDIELARPGYMAPTAVQLASFTAFATNEGVKVSWITQSELGCDSWAIERSSVEGDPFQLIGTLAGQGTTNEPHNYLFTDKTALNPGTYYYRLAEIDNDGKEYYGPISVLVNGRSSIYSLHQAYPNPTKGTATIKYSLKVSGQTSLKIYNILGAEVKTLINERQDANDYEVIWDGRDNNGRDVSKGIYFYKLISGQFNATRKLILLR